MTGAGAGIGQAIAWELAARGATVGVLDINAAAASATAAVIVGRGGSAVGVQGDVSDAKSVEGAVAEVADAFGAIGIVINNAGILDDFLPVLDTSEELWDRVLAVNLTGMFLVARATLPAMIESGGGVFVNIASGAALVAGMGGTAYTSSKHGVIGLTKQIASDYGPMGIRANAICPGSIDTELSRLFLKDNPAVQKIVDGVPAGRQGKASEIAKLAAFLASEDSTFMTGASVAIDGGWTVR
ncbi:MAG: 2-hydroxypropyl-CoM dehydrogenase [Nocardioides sp.]|nr:2-hydroxypropyl-CoM dehydrogenase [Nocardioides sp.]